MNGGISEETSAKIRLVMLFGEGSLGQLARRRLNTLNTSEEEKTTARSKTGLAYGEAMA
jgi:hypothetical protein